MNQLLNDVQESAVKHIGSPLLVVAGPGSGKTRVIVERILHFIRNGVKPSEILCLTFSNKAAEEMKQRLEKIIEISDMQLSTIHSFARDLLLDNVLVSGVGLSRGIMGRQSQLVWGLKNIDTFNLQFLEVGNNAVEVVESIIDGISTFKNELVGCEDLNRYLETKLKQDLDDESRSFYLKLADMAKVYEKFQVFQRSKSVVDFDDLIIEAVNLLKKRIDITKKYQRRFKHIFIDEFQDNNFGQLELIKLISQNGNVTAVGDDDQCIYKFQGAYLTIFRDFLTFFDDAKVITLNQNYRSTQNIVKVASQLFDNISKRQSKELYSENEQGEKIFVTCCQNESSEIDFVISTIKDLVGKPIIRRDKTTHLLSYRDIAILSRKKSLGQKFANGLKAHGIPVTTSGESNLFANPLVKDFIGFLKIASDPGRSGIEIIHLMIHSGVSERNIAEINRIAKKKAYADTTDIDFIYDTLKDYPSLNITQTHILEELKTQTEKLIIIGNTLSLSELIYTIITSISGLYKQSLISDNPTDRRNRLILKELSKISLEFESLNPHASVSDFISHLSLMGEFEIELEEGNEFDNAVWVTTIHQSKGKEFPVVFIVDVAADRLPLRYQAKKFYVPSDLSKGVKITEDEKELYNQEERRLFYVAMTRAQNMLFITYAKTYGDNIKETKPSRFLKEINFDENPLIKYEEFIGEDGISQSFLVANKIERIKTDLQLKAIKAISQMNLKTAVEKIIDLSKLKYYEENNTFEGFDSSSIIKLDYTDNFSDDIVSSKHIPLINKDTLKLSVSKLDIYKDCPLKFKFVHVLEIPSAPRSFFDLGTSIHTTIEHLTNLEKEGIKITERIALEILDKEWITYSFNSETEATQAKDKATNMIRTYLNWNTMSRNTPLEAEKKFSIKIAEIPFHGSIDRVEITPEGEFEVIDFKSGSVYETKKSIRDNFQMNVYALATEKLYGKLPKSASLFYLKKDKIILNTFESSYLKKVTETLENMVKSILEEDFKPNPSFKTCRMCDYKIICDHKMIK